MPTFSISTKSLWFNIFCDYTIPLGLSFIFNIWNSYVCVHTSGLTLRQRGREGAHVHRLAFLQSLYCYIESLCQTNSIVVLFVYFLQVLNISDNFAHFCYWCIIRNNHLTETRLQVRSKPA